MGLPKCCGQNMTKRIETNHFIEAACDRCGDIVYVKKSGHLPQLVDD